VPSTVILLGRWNWWPSKMSRQQVLPGPAEPGAGEPSRDVRQAEAR